ncbi:MULTISPECIES: hypothetical protein [Psychrobacter]|uniref:hypothetical protein n=1 Tax=Psychrobacter TaxID=497 RepID=UPI00097F499B|nr:MULTISPECIES: hypothetical protein [Psychrobacter]SJN43870.1 hypothetical protein CZ794_13240 [Psychrobacter sp. JB385]
MRQSVLNTALSTALIVALGFGVSACSSDKEGEHGSHEVLAIDRVDEAAEMARAKAPEAEKMDFPEAAAPMPAAEGEAAVEGAATTDATMTEAATADTATATDSTDAAPAADATTENTATTDTVTTDAAPQ